MIKIKNILNSKNLILITSLLTSVFVSFFAISPAIANVKKDMDMHINCITNVFPENTERDISIDSESGIIMVRYEKDSIKKEIALNLREDSKFSECNSTTKELITLAQNITSKIESDTCQELKEIISGAQPLPLLDGKKMDTKNATDYINKHCQ